MLILPSVKKSNSFRSPQMSKVFDNKSQHEFFCDVPQVLGVTDCQPREQEKQKIGTQSADWDMSWWFKRFKCHKLTEQLQQRQTNPKGEAGT